MQNYLNCDVIATAGIYRKKWINVWELGADHVVNHREPDWYKKVRNLTNNQGGIDVIFEHIGKSVFPKEVSRLKYGWNFSIYRSNNRI